jgi:hypothetical protein
MMHASVEAFHLSATGTNSLTKSLASSFFNESESRFANTRKLDISPRNRLLFTNVVSMSTLTIWRLLRELVPCPEVWLAQCLCESNESLPYRNLVESAKAEEQRIRIRKSQSTSIDGENLNTLGRRQFFRLS